jgi:hypothetical protein
MMYKMLEALKSEEIDAQIDRLGKKLETMPDGPPLQAEPSTDTAAQKMPIPEAREES